MRENYVDSYRKLLEGQEDYMKTGNLPINLYRGDKTLVATVEPLNYKVHQVVVYYGPSHVLKSSSIGVR